MNDGSKISGEIKLEPETKFGKKLDNFWYYHKWHVIVALFVTVILTVCIIQCATRDKNDVQLLFGGALSSSDPITEEMRTAFSDVEPESVGDDGVGLNVLEIYNEKDPAHQDKVTPTSKTNYNNLCNLITSGEYSVLIIDKWIYEDIKDSVGFRKVKELVGDAISEDQLYDETAVYFKQTAFAKKYSGTFSKLSDDTVICLCIYSPYKSTLSCGGSVDSDYETAEEMFKAILNYK